MSLLLGLASTLAEPKVKDLLESDGEIVTAIRKALAGKAEPAPALPEKPSLIQTLPEIGEYETFDLRLVQVRRGGIDQLVIEATGLGGEALDIVAMPAFNNMGTGAVGPFRGARVVAVAGAPVAPLPSLEQLGRQLGEQLMGRNVLGCFKAAKALADSRGKGLRIRLFIYDPLLAAVPWEIAHFEDDFVALRPRTPVFRYVLANTGARGVAPTPPVRVLGVVSGPQGGELAPINSEREKKNIEDALRPLRDQRLVELDWLDGARPEAFQQRVFTGYDVVHFIGHGTFDETTGEGQLIFTGDAGMAKPMPSKHFIRLVRDTRVRFVFVNACQSGREVGGIAEELVRGGVAAAIGMRRDVRDTVAVDFSQMFYQALAQGWPVEAAMVQGRLFVISKGGGFDTDGAWSDPILFSRSPDGRIF